MASPTTPADPVDLGLPRAAATIAYQRVPDGAILLSADDEVYFGLNSVGARVWELLPECVDVAELCRRVAEEYPDADPAVVSEDVRDLLAALRDNRLVG